jgi:signal peptidase II
LPDSSPAIPRPQRARAAPFILLAAIATAIYGADQLVKFEIVTNFTLGEQRDFLGKVVTLHFVQNSGAAFSLGSGSTWIFAIIATVVAIFIVVFSRRIRSLGWASVFGLLLGGTLGNLSDRLFREPGFGVGHVVDFVEVLGFPGIFNIADTAIVTSMGLFIILSLRGIALDGTRTFRAKRSRPREDASLAKPADGS